MPADYAEVLRDLDAAITSLEAEVATLKAARPTIVLLRNKFSPVARPQPMTPPPGAYAYMGPTRAIPFVLEGQLPMTTGEIVEKLKAGGLQTNGQNFNSNIAATLSRLRDNGIVEKVGEAWRLKPTSDVPAQEAVAVSAPASSSLAATVLALSSPNASQQPSEQ